MIKKVNPTLELTLRPRAAAKHGVEVHNASNCEHYWDNEFDLDPDTVTIIEMY